MKTSTAGSLAISLETALEEAEAKSSKDYLRVSRDMTFTQSLQDAEEEVMWADYVDEVTKKGKSHRRAFVVTTLACYTFNSGNYRTPTLRIPIKSISGLAFSDAADDLVIRCSSDGKVWFFYFFC